MTTDPRIPEHLKDRVEAAKARARQHPWHPPAESPFKTMTPGQAKDGCGDPIGLIYSNTPVQLDLSRLYEIRDYLRVTLVAVEDLISDLEE